MLETIPDYSPQHNSQHKTATGVDLAPVVITPSRLLWHIQRVTYAAMLLSASIAILPFVLTAFYWSIVWLFFVLLIMFVLRAAWRVQQAAPITLSVTQQRWRLQTPMGELVVAPCNEILLWTGVIVLPVQEALTGRKHRIVMLPDSMPAEDWRRLRVWLRMGLSKNI